jgi:hypothetical protein
MWNDCQKFIFIHPKKCGGSSIEILLRKNFTDNIEPKHSQHFTLSDVSKLIKNPLNDYFVFGCIRNPWNRMVSLYYHSIKHDKMATGLTFNEYIRRPGHWLNNNLSGKSFFMHNGEYRMDAVAKLENFSEEMHPIMAKLNIANYKIPCYDHGTSRPKIPYQEYYSKETKDFVAKKFEWDIEFFNYKFD